MIEQDLSFVRGDSFSFSVKIKDKNGEEIIVGDEGQIYFTVKENYNVENFVIQKKLNNGIEYDENEGYVVSLNTNDTNTLSYGRYKYDVEYKLNDFVKTIARGNLKLEKEVTFKGNED